MITAVTVEFDVRAYESYLQLVSHPFLASRCRHHTQELLGESCTGEKWTVIQTHTEKHRIELYESWDGCHFRLTNPKMMDYQLLGEALLAFMDCGVMQLTLTLKSKQYQVTNLVKLTSRVAMSYSSEGFFLLGEFLERECARVTQEVYC